MAFYTPEEKAREEPRLPPGFILTYAADWGWFVQQIGKRNNVTGTFHIDARVIISEAIASGKMILRREDIFLRKSAYLNPEIVGRLPYLPHAAGNRYCPKCNADAGDDFDAPGYVGITEPQTVAGIQTWTEVWECVCGCLFKYIAEQEIV